MPDRFEADLSKIDLKSLTSAEWEALKREVHRRALAERNRVMRALCAGAVSWVKKEGASVRAWAARLLSSNPRDAQSLRQRPQRAPQFPHDARVGATQ